jgi:hypothetical protein
VCKRRKEQKKERGKTALKRIDFTAAFAFFFSHVVGQEETSFRAAADNSDQRHLLWA